MRYKIELSQEAQIELDVNLCFFRAQDLDLSKEFLEGFKRCLTFLATNPELFQKRYKEIRIVHFEEFKYSIHYVIHDKSVKILRILHQKQWY